MVANNRVAHLLAVVAAAVAAASPAAVVCAFHTSPSSLSTSSSSVARPPRRIPPLFSSVPERSAASGSPPSPPLSTLVDRVAVAGATGRTGRYVVEELLSRNVRVLALVRDVDKAKSILDPTNELLAIRKVDLGNRKEVISALVDGGDGGCDAAIWCATGFSDSPEQDWLTKLTAIFGFATNSKASIDAVGLPALGEGLAMRAKGGNKGGSNGVVALPKIVMLSSAGVTRPDWSDEKKLALEGSAAIPIVRLNPFGILGLKKESEEKLRACGVDYCIFRPCGLNDNWSPNQRPIFSQGDVAVGRINRKDVAKILVDILSTPEATGKTFEAFSIANSEGCYPPPADLGPALSRLVSDAHDGGRGLGEDAIRATYALMQQLLPGEKQDAAGLAMGQTYEQLDRDEKGRLGVRGTEVAPIKKT